MKTTALGGKGNWQDRWRALLAVVRIVADEASLQQFLRGLGEADGPHILAFVNAHAMNCVASSPSFAKALVGADVILRDGSGMAALYRMLAQDSGLNLNGTDLIPRILRLYAGRKIALLGTEDRYLAAAATEIHSHLAPGSVIVQLDGFREMDAYLGLVAREKPDLLVLGMGMPKQELLAASLRDSVSWPCLIVCGGAIIDFLGGKVERAPLWMRRLGIEWVFRLLREPRRLFQRYVVGNPLFLWRSLRLAVSRS